MGHQTNSLLKVTPLQVLLGLAVVTSLLLQARPLTDFDLFTQIELGCGNELLLSATPDQVNPGWLSQRIYCSIDRGFGSAPWGLGALRWFHAVLFASGLFLSALATLAIRTDRKTLPIFALIGGWVLALIPALSNMSARSQAFAFFFFGLCLLLWTSSNKKAPFLFATLAVAILWQNIHSSLSLAGLLWFGLLPTFWREFSVKKLPKILLIPLPLAVAYFLTPIGFGQQSFAALNLENSRALGITEWLPPFAEAIRSATWPFLVVAPIAILLMSILRRRTGSRFAFGAAFILFTLLALTATRFILFWSLLALPIITEILERMLLKRSTRRPGSLFAKSVNLGDLSVRRTFSQICFALALSLLPLLNTRSVIDPRIPLQTIKLVAEQYPDAVVYNYREWSGPLAYFGSKNWKLTIDGRLYLFSRAELEKYNREARGVEFTSNADVLFLRRDFHAALIRKLEGEPTWQRAPVPNNELAEIFVQKAAESPREGINR